MPDSQSYDSAVSAVADGSSIQSQVEAVERLAVLTEHAVLAVTKAFLAAAGTPNQYLIWERLGRFGDLPIKPLERALPTAEGATRTLASAALLVLGSRAGLTHVLAALDPTDGLACVAARCVASANVQEAIPRLRTAIELAEGGSDVHHCLVMALNLLAGDQQ